MRAARNITIIALLALVVAAVPGGGNLAEGIVAVLTLAFLGILGAVGFLLYRQNQLDYLTLEDRPRMILLGALGAIVLMIAAADELLDTGAGLLVWVGILGLAIFGIARVVIDARSL